MDALGWHRLLTAPSIPPPTGMSPARYRRLTTPERLAHADSVADWFGTVVFDSPLVGTVTSQMLDRFRVNSRSPVGAKEIVAVDGPFGVGKTTLIHGVARRSYRGLVTGPTDARVPTWTPEVGVTHDFVPVMWVQLQAGSSLKTLYTSILAFLRFPLHGAGGVLASRALRALTRFGVQLLILDDVHKLRETQQASRDIIDALHTINTTLGGRGGTLCLIGKRDGDACPADPPADRQPAQDLPPGPVHDQYRARQTGLAAIPPRHRDRLPAPAADGLAGIPGPATPRLPPRAYPRAHAGRSAAREGRRPSSPRVGCGNPGPQRVGWGGSQ